MDTKVVMDKTRAGGFNTWCEQQVKSMGGMEGQDLDSRSTFNLITICKLTQALVSRTYLLSQHRNMVTRWVQRQELLGKTRALVPVRTVCNNMNYSAEK